MAVTFPTTPTSASGTASPATCNAPTGRVAGDELLVVYTQDSTSRNITTPAGWRLLAGPVTTGNHRASLFDRTADGTASDDFSATLSGATNWLTDMVAATGVHATPIANTGTDVGSAANASATTHATPSITPSINGSHIFAVWSYDGGGANSVGSYTAGMTELYDVTNQTAGALGCAAAEGAGPDPAAAVSKQATLAGAEIVAVFIVALQPAAVGGTPVRLLSCLGVGT